MASMAVLVEAISVVFRLDAVRSKWNGGWDAFVELVPNNTLCYDDYLARVGFMDPDRVRSYIGLAARSGLTPLEDDQFKDLAVVDQVSGPTALCKWLEFGRLPFGDSGAEVSACWFMPISRRDLPGLHIPDTETGHIAVPHGWTIDHSPSMHFVPNESVQDELTFLRYEDGLAVFRREASGQEVFFAGGESAIRAAATGLSPVDATLWDDSFGALTHAIEMLSGFMEDPASIEDVDRARIAVLEILPRLASARRGFEQLSAAGVREDVTRPLAQAAWLLYEGNAAPDAKRMKEGILLASRTLAALAAEPGD
jgi:hypothetical protein